MKKPLKDRYFKVTGFALWALIPALALMTAGFSWTLDSAPVWAQSKKEAAKTAPKEEKAPAKPDPEVKAGQDQQAVPTTGFEMRKQFLLLEQKRATLALEKARLDQERQELERLDQEVSERLAKLKKVKAAMERLVSPE
ncbi:MAG: hypothetical protein PVG03_06140 [Desulfarculaceae bacterium]|jgi:hypothetical protein